MYPLARAHLVPSLTLANELASRDLDVGGTDMGTEHLRGSFGECSSALFSLIFDCLSGL
jgi:hypothetical protein